jgi:hypothetical protein
MKEKLKQLIENKYGDIYKMDGTKRSESFLEVYKALVELMERDFNYALQIIERK